MNPKTQQILVSGALVTLALSLAACDESVDSIVDRLPVGGEEEIELAVEAMQQGSLEMALLAALTLDVELVDEESEMAAEVAASASDVFTPSDCVEALATGDSVTFTFRDCSGPFGLRAVRGAANLVFVDALLETSAVAFTSSGIEINADELTAVNLTGEIGNNEEGSKRWDMITAGGGVSGDNEPLTRSGTFLASMNDEGCLVMNGGWNVTILTDLYPAVFRSFTRCESACPDSGTMLLGEAEFDYEALEATDSIEGDFLTLTFVGSRTVAWANRSGRVGSTSLICE